MKPLICSCSEKGAKREREREVAKWSQYCSFDTCYPLAKWSHIPAYVYEPQQPSFLNPVHWKVSYFLCSILSWFCNTLYSTGWLHHSIWAVLLLDMNFPGQYATINKTYIFAETKRLHVFDCKGTPVLFDVFDCKGTPALEPLQIHHWKKKGWSWHGMLIYMGL